MYKTLLELNGTLDTVETINSAIETETGISEFFDTESEEWRAWVDYVDGKTRIYMEEA